MKRDLVSIYNTFKSIKPIGIDGISKENYDGILESELEIIERKIENMSYDFSYYKEKLIVKSKEKIRVISIPTLRDQLVLKYLYNIIQECFSIKMNTKNTVKSYIKEIKEAKDNFECFIKIDIQNFYPSVNHEILMGKLALLQNEKIESLIQKAITQTTVTSDSPKSSRIKYNNTLGVPQGLSISGILAELYLQQFDTKYTKNKKIKYFRFVDDIVILCNNDDILKIQRSLKRELKKLKLTSHSFVKNSQKSSIGKIGERFEYLGYVFEDTVLSVREASSKKMFLNLSKIFTKYKHGGFSSSYEFYRKLNLKITGCVVDNKEYGWIPFFSLMNDYKLLYLLDSFVEKNCSKLGIDYNLVKRFSKAFFELKNPNSTYRPVFSSFDLDESFIMELEEDVEFY